MNTFLNDLPGEMSDPIPSCSNCGDSGTYDNFVGERDFCDCSAGEVAHSNWCGEVDDSADDCAQARLDEMDYQAGKAQGERYSSDRQIYGDALAEQFAMDDELASYNRGEF